MEEADERDKLLGNRNDDNFDEYEHDEFI